MRWSWTVGGHAEQRRTVRVKVQRKTIAETIDGVLRQGQATVRCPEDAWYPKNADCEVSRVRRGMPCGVWQPSRECFRAWQTGVPTVCAYRTGDVPRGEGNSEWECSAMQKRPESGRDVGSSACRGWRVSSPPPHAKLFSALHIDRSPLLAGPGQPLNKRDRGIITQPNLKVIFLLRA